MSKLAILGGAPVCTKPFARWPVFDGREKAALTEVLESGSWGGYNPVVRRFESAFAAFHGVPYAVTTSNGTVTLEGALLAAGIKPGDEVIVPPISFISTATAVLRVGAIPVFADVGRDYNLDPVRVAEALTPRTRAIIPVHFAGRPAGMDNLGVIARARNLTVVEDAAHAHGASWQGRPAGSLGHIASFSFQQSKNLTAGEGGILIGNNEALIESARSIFNQGRRPGGAWYEHVRLGTNQRLTAWQAAILMVQLERLPAQLEQRARSAEQLDRLLAQFDFVELPPPDPRVTRHSYYLYMLRLRLDKLAGLSKDVFLEALAAEGIPGAGSYPRPLYEHKLFEQYEFVRTSCPEAEAVCRESFWVSHEVMLAAPADLECFAAALEKIAANAGELARYAGQVPPGERS